MGKPFEQILAEGLTTAAISIGAASSAVKVARAKAALGVSSYFTILGAGNISGATTQLTNLVKSISDPGIQQTVTDLVSIGEPFLAAEAQGLEDTPLIGESIEATLTNIGAGMATIANAYIAASAAKPAAAPAAQAHPAAPAPARPAQGVPIRPGAPPHPQ